MNKQTNQLLHPNCYSFAQQYFVNVIYPQETLSEIVLTKKTIIYATIHLPFMEEV